MVKTLVEQYVESPAHMRLFQQERAIYEVTELIESVMEADGVSRAELARKLGRSKGWVTQLLDGEANKTIRTVTDVLAVLGREYHSFERPIQIGSRATPCISTVGVSATKDVRPEVEHILSMHRASSSPAEQAHLQR